MTVQSQTFQTSFPAIRIPAMPRGARIAAALFTRAANWFETPVRQLSRAEEALAVRELADRMRNTDPGFAADLYAAAARHESNEA
jgi:hypothetical protein